MKNLVRIKLWTVVIAAIAAMSVFATDMDHKGRVIAEVATANAGTAEITCNDPGG